MARLGRQRKAVATSAKEARKTLVCAVCGKGDGKYKCPKCMAPYCCVQCSKDHKTVHCPFVTDTSKTKGEGASSKHHSENSTNVKSDEGNAAEKSKYLPGKVAIPSKQAFRRKRRRDNDEDSDDQDDEPGWNITPEMKKRIQQCSWLKKELQDGGLRHLIATIDAASDAEDDEDDIDEQNGNATKFKKQKNYQKNANAATPKISPRVLELARTKHSHPKFANFIDKLLLTMGVLIPADDGNKDRDLSTLLNEILNGEGDESYRGRLVLAPVPRQGRILESDDVSDSDSDSSDESEDEESSEDSSSSSEEDEVCATKGEN